jgi:hypothetical protein
MYSKEADELAKIVSGRITIPLNVFAQHVTKPSVNLCSAPSNREEPSGAPSSPVGAEPMDEDPSTEAFVLSLLEGYGADKARATETGPPPAWRIGGPNTSLGSLEGSSPRIGPRPGASPEKPSRSLWSKARCISVPRPVSCSDGSPFPTAGKSFETSMRACVATTRRRAPSSATHSTKVSIGPPWSLMPTRSCALARGANFTHARPISQLMPCKPYLSHGHSSCGG